ncbi:protein disconnected-like [Polistes fuscatus]|uniref:protein disconnected-like n=1 Tax=Polistes fuscatus TaxID=30207 RepID=UPI001CA8070B|nr:protein disconnected-like [Polistes fuscatus]
MSGHVVETTSELSDFMKAGVMAESERDGSCSGGDEDDMSGLHSLSASEDSVEVQVTPISLRNKRKLAEPRKIQEPSTAPLKKRRFEQIEETVVADEESRPARSPSPFRPWSSPTSKSNDAKTSTTKATSSSTSTSNSTNAVTTIVSSTSTSSSARELEREEEEEIRKRREARIKEEALLMRLREVSNRSPDSTIQTRGNAIPRRETRQRFEQLTPTSSSPIPPTPGIVLSNRPKLQEEPLALVLRGEIPRVPSHPAVSGTYERAPSTYPLDHHQQQPHHSHHHRHHHHHHHHPHQNHPIPPHRQQNHQAPATQQTNHSRHPQSTTTSGGTGQQRNYKNMTRERRIEANARERTRVHTISAAFDTLRRTIPAYSHNQKLSKLSVLRIACSYIMTLSKLNEINEGQQVIGSSFAACVDLVSRTIQTEGKLRKRKED